jgi:hypothetical protein
MVFIIIMKNYFRSYFSQNNTIIKGAYNNTGLNPVSELWYGESFGITGNSFTRLLFKVDLSKIIERYNTNEIMTGDTTVKHTLKMFNSAAYDRDMLDRDLEGRTRNKNFTLVLYRIEEDWSEGRGFDFPSQFISTESGNTITSNWFEKKQDELWSIAGAISADTGNTIASQYFEVGDENLEMDITPFVNDIITGGSDNYGFALAYHPDIENVSGVLGLRTVGFFTRHLDYFYEPFIETEWESNIEDDREFFYIGKTNNLYLYTNKAGRPFDLDFTPSAVTILDYNDDVIETITGNSIVHVKRGVYKIEYNVPINSYPDRVTFTDRWEGLFDNGVNIGNVELKFDLKNNRDYYSLENYENSHINYTLQLLGINHNDKLVNGEKRRIDVRVRDNRNRKETNISEIFYRVFIKEGKYEIDVIPFNKMNRNAKMNFFDLDTSWLVPTDYYLEIKIQNNGYDYIFNRRMKFTVVNQINNNGI